MELPYDYNEDQPAFNMGRARVRNPSPCTPWNLHCAFPIPGHSAYVGAGVIYLLYTAIICQSFSPRPSSDESDMELTLTSGPPSLENVTGPDLPESGYEASNLNTNSIKKPCLCFVKFCCLGVKFGYVFSRNLFDWTIS